MFILNIKSLMFKGYVLEICFLRKIFMYKKVVGIFLKL